MKSVSLNKRLALYLVIFIGNIILGTASTSLSTTCAALAVVIASFLLGYAIRHNEFCKKFGRGSGTRRGL